MKKSTKKATKKATPKTATSYRLSGEVVEKIAALQKHHGINATAVIEMAVRGQARKDGV